MTRRTHTRAARSRGGTTEDQHAKRRAVRLTESESSAEAGRLASDIDEAEEEGDVSRQRSGGENVDTVDAMFVSDINEGNVDAGSDAFRELPNDDKIVPKMTLKPKSQLYKVRSEVIELDKVDFLENTAREISDKWVKNFIRKFTSFGYIPTNGVIQVTPNPKKPGRYILVDGAHRLTALCIIRERKLKDQFGSAPASAVEMAVKELKDGKPMTDVEILLEAGAANAGALTPLPMSTGHQLQWSTHIMGAMARTQNLQLAPGNVNVGKTAEQLLKSGNVPSSNKGVPVQLQSLKRFVTIGIMLAVSPLTQKRLMRYLTILEADRMMVRAIKKKKDRPAPQAGESSLACEGLVSPAFIFCPGTPREDADIVRDKMLEIAWLWTGVAKPAGVPPNRLKQGCDSMFFTVLLVFLNHLRVAVRVAKRQLEGASAQQVASTLAARKQYVEKVIERKRAIDNIESPAEREARRRERRITARNAPRQKRIDKLQQKQPAGYQVKILRLMSAMNKETGSIASDSESSQEDEGARDFLVHGSYEVGPDFDVANMWGLVHPFLGGETMTAHLTALFMEYDVSDVEGGGTQVESASDVEASDDDEQEELHEDEEEADPGGRKSKGKRQSSGRSAGKGKGQRKGKKAKALGVKRGATESVGVDAARAHGFFQKHWGDWCALIAEWVRPTMPPDPTPPSPLPARRALAGGGGVNVSGTGGSTEGDAAAPNQVDAGTGGAATRSGGDAVDADGGSGGKKGADDGAGGPGKVSSPSGQAVGDGGPPSSAVPPAEQAGPRGPSDNVDPAAVQKEPDAAIVPAGPSVGGGGDEGPGGVSGDARDEIAPLRPPTSTNTATGGAPGGPQPSAERPPEPATSEVAGMTPGHEQPPTPTPAAAVGSIEPGRAATAPSTPGGGQPPAPATAAAAVAPVEPCPAGTAPTTPGGGHPSAMQSAAADALVDTGRAETTPTTEGGGTKRPAPDGGTDRPDGASKRSRAVGSSDGGGGDKAAGSAENAPSLREAEGDGGSTGADAFPQPPPDMPDTPAQMSRADRQRMATRKASDLPRFAELLPDDHPARGVVDTEDFIAIDQHVTLYGRWEVTHGIASEQPYMWNINDAPSEIERHVTAAEVHARLLYTVGHEELHERGYTIYTNALRTGTPSRTRFHLRSYLRHFHQALPDEATLRERHEADVLDATEFCFIHNRVAVDDPAIASRGEGRLMTTAQYLASELQRASGEVYMSKQNVDLFLAAMVWRTLHGGIQRNNRRIGPMCIPRTGSRLLVTTKGAERQRPHTDTPIPDGAYGPDVAEELRPVEVGAGTPPLTQVPEHLAAQHDAALFEKQSPASSSRDAGSHAAPSYFVMASAEDGFPLWVWPDSHNYACRLRDGMEGKSVPPPARLLQIPPYSVLIVRGDLVHAGAADVDDHYRHGLCGVKKVRSYYRRNIRAHMYVRKVGDTIQDAIYPAPDVFTFLPPARGGGEATEAAESTRVNSGGMVIEE